MEKELLQEIEEAQMVLVGFGEALDAVEFQKMESYAESALNEVGVSWLAPLFWERLREDIYSKGLERLAKLLEHKNYFVISQAQNSAIFQTKWREGRLVMPYGCWRKKQCTCMEDEIVPTPLDDEAAKALTRAVDSYVAVVRSVGSFASHDNDAGSVGACSAFKNGSETQNECAGIGNLESLPDPVREAMEEIQRRKEITDAANELKRAAEGILGKCERCGAPYTLNVIQNKNYDMHGYQLDWERYTKWLSGSVNRKLLLLEIGADERIPGLIHGPFAKISELNLKSTLRTYANAIDWLGNL
jgi:hypothetical protein